MTSLISLTEIEFKALKKKLDKLSILGVRILLDPFHNWPVPLAEGDYLGSSESRAEIYTARSRDQDDDTFHALADLIAKIRDSDGWVLDSLSRLERSLFIRTVDEAYRHSEEVLATIPKYDTSTILHPDDRIKLKGLACTYYAGQIPVVELLAYTSYGDCIKALVGEEYSEGCATEFLKAFWSAENALEGLKDASGDKQKLLDVYRKNLIARKIEGPLLGIANETVLSILKTTGLGTQINLNYFTLLAMAPYMIALSQIDGRKRVDVIEKIMSNKDLFNWQNRSKWINAMKYAPSSSGQDSTPVWRDSD